MFTQANIARTCQACLAEGYQASACPGRQIAHLWRLFRRVLPNVVFHRLPQTDAWDNHGRRGTSGLRPRALHEHGLVDVRHSARLFVVGARHLSRARDSARVGGRHRAHLVAEESHRLLRVFFAQDRRLGALRPGFGDDHRFARVHDLLLGGARQLARLSADLVDEIRLGGHHDVGLGRALLPELGSSANLRLLEDALGFLATIRPPLHLLSVLNIEIHAHLVLYSSAAQQHHRETEPPQTSPHKILHDFCHL